MGLNHGRARNISLLQNVQMGPNHFLFIWHQGFYPGVKQLESEVKHTSPSTSKGEDKRSYTPHPPKCLNGITRENYIKVTFHKALKWPINQKSITLSISIHVENSMDSDRGSIQ